jgi:hypothetical protein
MAVVDLEGDVVAVAQDDELAVEGAVDRPVLGIAGLEGAGEASHWTCGHGVRHAVHAKYSGSIGWR